MMQDVQQVKALLARFGLSPNRGLGQNFLVDGDKAEAIADKPILIIAGAAPCWRSARGWGR